MKRHVKAIGLINIFLGVLTIYVGASTLSSNLGLKVGILIILLGISMVVTAINLRGFKPWARVAQILISAFGLLIIPFGTMLGIYVLWALLNKESTPLFEAESSSTTLT